MTINICVALINTWWVTYMKWDLQKFIKGLIKAKQFCTSSD